MCVCVCGVGGGGGGSETSAVLGGESMGLKPFMDEAPPLILQHGAILLHGLLFFVSATHHSHIVESGMVSWSNCPW